MSNDIVVTKQIAIRTFELVEPVSGKLHGTLDDWPAAIQDPILLALERVSVRVGLPLTIVASRSDEDVDVPEGHPGRFFVHVIASEIVAADERTLPPGTVVRPIPAAMSNLWKQ